MVELTPEKLIILGIVRGLAWPGVDFTRLPAKARKSLSPALWEKARMPSGVRLCFKARCDDIILDVEYENANDHPHVSRAASGFDIYVDGEFHVNIPARAGPGPMMGFFRADGSQVHEYTIYMPYLAILKLNALVLEREDELDCEIEALDGFGAGGKPLVFYGSSITHGSHASRPGLTYPAIVARRLGMDFVNLGFGGTGKGEPEVADLLASIPDPAMYILDWGINICSADEKDLIYPRYGALFRRIRQAHPDVPVLMVNVQTFGDAGPAGDANREILEEIRVEIKRVFDEESSKAGEKGKLHYIDAMRWINPGNVSELTTDRTHPNQAGFQEYANALVPVIENALRVAGIEKNGNPGPWGHGGNGELR